jgi:hypothetical protein
MVNLHIEWRQPGTGEFLIRCNIPDSATDEILEKVLNEEREIVRRGYGDKVAETVRWRVDANWKNRLGNKV